MNVHGTSVGLAAVVAGLQIADAMGGVPAEEQGAAYMDVLHRRGGDETLDVGVGKVLLLNLNWLLIQGW